LCFGQVIQQEEYEYTDPVTEFLSNLFVKYDFDSAQQSLMQCEKLLENDFFLAACKVGCPDLLPRTPAPLDALTADGQVKGEKLRMLFWVSACE
jgi:hypothetical protein